MYLCTHRPSGGLNGYKIPLGHLDASKTRISIPIAMRISANPSRGPSKGGEYIRVRILGSSILFIQRGDANDIS